MRPSSDGSGHLIQMGPACKFSQVLKTLGLETNRHVHDFRKDYNIKVAVVSSKNQKGAGFLQDSCLSEG